MLLITVFNPNVHVTVYSVCKGVTQPFPGSCMSCTCSNAGRGSQSKKIRFDITLYIQSCHMLSRNIMSYIWKGVAHT